MYKTSLGGEKNQPNSEAHSPRMLSLGFCQTNLFPSGTRWRFYFATCLLQVAPSASLNSFFCSLSRPTFAIFTFTRTSGCLGDVQGSLCRKMQVLNSPFPSLPERKADTFMRLTVTILNAMQVYSRSLLFICLNSCSAFNFFYK